MNNKDIKTRNIKQQTDKTIGYLILISLMKNGSMTVEELRNHWSLNDIAIGLVLHGLLEKGLVSQSDNKVSLKADAAFVYLPQSLRPMHVIENSESTIVTTIIVRHYLVLFDQVGDFKFGPSHVWAGPFAPCTKSSWPDVLHELKVLGYAHMFHSTVINWKKHPAYNSAVEGAF
ncbi:MAG: hypothetical protein ACPH5T_05065 [Candidatus Poseidoniaceae archaeon]